MYSLVQASTPVEQILSKPEPATQRAGAELTAAALWNYMAGLIMFLLHRDILKTRILPVVFLFLICGLVPPDDPRGSVLAGGSCWSSRELRSSLGPALGCPSCSKPGAGHAPRPHSRLQLQGQSPLLLVCYSLGNAERGVCYTAELVIMASVSFFPVSADVNPKCASMVQKSRGTL